MVNIEQLEITLVELTIPFNSPESLANARNRKESKENYQLALSNLESLGYTVA